VKTALHDPSAIAFLTPFNKRLVEVNPANAEAAIRVANRLRAEKKIDGVNILRFWDVPTAVLSKLAPMKQVHLQRCGKIDVTPLYETQSKLEHLALTDDPVDIDLARFANLRSFSGFWSRKSTGLETLRKLESLRIWKLDDRHPDVASLNLSPTLETLWFTQSKIRSLRGIERLKKITQIELAYLRQTLDVCGIGALKKLHSFRCERVAGIENVEELATCRALEYIQLENCGSIPSIRWIAKMPNIAGLDVEGTKVRDGHFAMLRKMPKFRMFSATRYPGYPRDFAEIQALVDARYEAWEKRQPG
jgi:hypothetical protein